ncbi:DUF6799 domain-containing protein [Hymenobacter weizhouensis]|uniref:DUF6799 domain-containing protein n=1 Tax=Hymenobacter sp. YIM 151500-1 TaxID=2987689 RepID=UPI00222743E8|nr:DUF6799 domain-containing protein [Hymenobacter sp. YIM 151500-1]UYZ61798.1 hypothetical protein OIS53_12375 [Hymenobacter sp. YIM 151500-1]
MLLPSLLSPLRCFLVGLMLLGSTALSALAQQTTPAPRLKDGVYRRSGKLLRLQGGRVTPLTQPLALGNGFTVYPNGTLVGPKGGRRQLANGQAVNLQGHVVSFRDDMLSAQAIEDHDRRTTGARPTTLVVPAREVVPVDLVARLRHTQERLHHLQQLSALLAARASAAAADPISADVAALDGRIQELSRQLQAK